MARESAFAENGLRASIDALIAEIQELYRSDSCPWVIGYSGGKDSTAVLQLVWLALEGLPAEDRIKTVEVISTDTLVENPIVAQWVARSLDTMAAAAEEQGLPVRANRLVPAVQDTFWVNLIGKGYPAPRHKFRWCTERMKIKPSNGFIMDVVKEHGETILVLGTRHAESSARAARMKQLALQSVRGRLVPNQSLPNSLVYTPIDDWTNDDVWLFLMQVKNPWGYNNKDLLTMYQGASADGECPLVVDTSTPSCGDSRFGCWVCTLVEKDKSMTAMIQNDEEKEWMLPLLELRNELDIKDDRHLRDFRRLRGNVQLFHDRPIPGPYTQEARARWLRRLLEAQRWVRDNGPSYVDDWQLITLPELEEIRRIWVVEKHEIEDLLPTIYVEEMEEPYPGAELDEHLPFGTEDLALLRQACGDDPLHYQMARDLLDIEFRFRTKTRRAGLFEALEGAIKRSFYAGEDDAAERARRRLDVIQQAREVREATEPYGESP